MLNILMIQVNIRIQYFLGNKKMKMQQNNQDQFQLQHFQKVLKQKTFQVIKSYLEHTEFFNPILIYLLVFIQTLQILWFSIHPLLTFLDNQFLLNYFRIILSYVNFENILQKNAKLLMPFVLICTCIIIIHVITVVISIRSINQQSKRNTQFTSLVNKITTIQILVINTVLVLPIYNISIITLYCDPQSYYYDDGSQECYNTTHIILCILSSFNLLVLILQTLVYWFLFYIRNPFSKSYYALPNNLFRLAKVVIKFLPPIYFIIQFKYQFQNVYVFMFLFLILAYIAFFRISSIHSFSQNYFYFQLYMESLILWFCINTVLCYQLSSSGMNFIQSCICSLIFAYTICTVQQTLNKNFLVNNLDGNVKKQDRQKLVYLLVNILFKQLSSQDVNIIVYIKLINANLNLCNIKISRFLHKNELKSQQVAQLTRQITLLLLQKFFQEGPSINLQLIKCRILFDAGYKILSLHEISELRHDKLSLYEQFILYYFKATHRIFDEVQVKSNQENMSQINNYLKFVQYMNDFQYQLQICSKNNQQFWQQLCQDMPSNNKVFSLAKRSHKFSLKIQQSFKKIESLFPQNLSCLMMYYQFLNHVCVRYKQFSKIKQKWNIQKQRQKHKQLSDLQDKNNKIRFRSNDKMCVLQISTNSSSIGTIINSNSQVKKYLGYDKSDLINQKVTKIMPKLYSQIHDDFIRDYLKKADTCKLPVQKTVFALKKSLKVIETCLTVKIFPNVMMGFQLVGFFKQKNSNQNYKKMIVNLKTLQIEGMSDGFIQMVGNRIKLTQTHKQPLKMSQIFPQIQPNFKFILQQQVKTVFRFSDCTDKLIDIDDISQQNRKKSEKKVILKLTNQKYYSFMQIGVFSISQFDEHLPSLQDTQTNNQVVLSETKISKKNFVEKQGKQKKELIQVISRQQTALQRKIQEFVSNQSHLTQILALKIIFLVIFIALLISSIFINIYQTFATSTYENLFIQLSTSTDITQNQGKLLILNRQLTQNTVDNSLWLQIKQQFQDTLKTLKQQIVFLFQKANQRKTESLVINQFQRLSFKSLFKNDTVVQYSRLFYLDGLLQIIFSGLDYSNKNFTYFYPQLDHQISQSMYFIEQNTKEMLPTYSIKTTLAYGSLFQKILHMQLFNQIYFATGKTLTYIILFVVMYTLLKKYSYFNFFVVQIYNNILKWDAYELYSKCRKFRYKIFQGASEEFELNSRNSDLLKVFPKGLLIKLSQGLINRRNRVNAQQKTSIFGIIDKKKNDNDKNDQEDKQTQKQKYQGSFQFEPLTNKADLINISIQNTFNKKSFLVLGLFILLICCNFSFILFRKSIADSILAQKTNIINLNAYKKNFLFTYFYGSRLSKGQIQFQSLYKNQLNIFYESSKNVSNLIGDPLTYLRSVYKNIQTLNSIVEKELQGHNQTQIDMLIQQIRLELFNISQELTKYSNSKYQQIISLFKQNQKITGILKIGLQAVITIIFCRLAHTHLLKAIQNQLQYSCNMMNMIPVWIIYKSKKIKNIILKNTQNKKMSKKAHYKQASKVQESAADFIESSNL